MSNGKTPIHIDTSDMDPNGSAAEVGFDPTVPSAFAPNGDHLAPAFPQQKRQSTAGSAGPTFH